MTVALFGDSTIESILLAHADRTGIAPQLQRALTARGLAPAGSGFTAPMPARMDFNLVAEPDADELPAGGWKVVGYGAHAGGAGPSAYTALTGYPTATATARIDGTPVAVLSGAGPGAKPFRVTAGAATFTIDPYADHV